MAQDIELSPRKILSYMRDLEEKLPKRKYGEFDPNSISNINNDDDLNAAARKMMDFVNLEKYVPQCTFCKTKENVGGFTFQRSDNIVPISVSELYKGNNAAVLAILAHEICHKVIYINGIRFDGAFDFMNEIFTDICTIYVGFGILILNGYRTSKGTSTCYLGYLKFNVYQDTYDIVKQILSGNENAKKAGTDIFLEQSFDMWHSDTDKHRLLMNSFADIQDEYSKLIRDITLLEQMTRQVTESYASTLDKADDYYFRRGDFFDSDTHELTKPIGAFSAIYENITSKVEQENLQNFDDIITQAMLSLVDRCNDIQIDRLKYNTFRCPFCSKEATNEKFDTRKLIVKCPSCKKHFHVNLEHWNYTEEIGRLRRLEKERCDQLIAQGKADGEKNGFQRGVKKGEADAVDRYLQSLPKWLRWLVKKHK